MIVTFVGGPRHGDHQSVDDPPPMLEAENRDGTVMEYLLRNPFQELKQVVVQIFYAPIQMTGEEFTRLSNGLRVP